MEAAWTPTQPAAANVGNGTWAQQENAEPSDGLEPSTPSLPSPLMSPEFAEALRAFCDVVAAQ